MVVDKPSVTKFIVSKYFIGLAHVIGIVDKPSPSICKMSIVIKAMLASAYVY